MSNDSFKNEQIRQECLKCLKNLNANFYIGGMACRAMDKEKTAWRVERQADINGIQSAGALLTDMASVYGICFLPAEDVDLLE